MIEQTQYEAHPTWWNDQYNTTWDRVKEALRRDWEQTKADLHLGSGRDLNQGVADTVKQAAGTEPLPLSHQPNPEPPAWKDAEPALRYGYGAGSYYHDQATWDDGVEAKLRQEWEDLKSGRTWEEVKAGVRHGWEAARRKLS